MARGVVAGVIHWLPGLADAAWFACLGSALTAANRRDALAYLEALGDAHAPVRTVTHWRDAERVARDPLWDTQWWSREGEGDEHLFMRKYALFASGRWPLGIVGGEFFLF